MYTNITGVILAGGKSKRMGENKALLTIGNITIIEHLTRLLQSIFNKVIIITNDPDEYRFLEVDLYPDVYLNKGPLAGIHSALVHSPADKIFVLSCDIPFITAEVIRNIIDYKTDHPITVVKADGFIQQLAGIYNKRILQNAEEILTSPDEAKKCRVLSLIDLAGAEIIASEKIPSCKKETFLNMNSRADYEEVRRILKEQS